MNEEDRYKLYEKLLEAAADQLGCEPSDERAKDLATIRMMRESITLNLIAGRNVDPTNLRWLIEQLAAVIPPPAIPPVRLEIIDRNGETCSLDELRQPVPPEPTPSAPPPDVGFVSFAPTPPPTPAIEAAPVAVHPNDLPRRDPGSIHNAVLNGVPARMTGASCGFVSGGSYQTVAGPFGKAAHQLPDADPRHYLRSRSDGTVTFAKNVRDRDPGGHGGSVCW
jgi:hypothetical protein